MSKADLPLTTQIRLQLVEVALSRCGFLVIGFAAVAALLAYLISSGLSPVYRASTLIRIDRMGTTVAPVDSAFLSQQLEILRSRPLAELVIDRLGLANRDLFRGEAGGRAAEFAYRSYARQLRVAQTAAGELLVAFDSADPRMSAEVVNIHASEYLIYSEQRAAELQAELEALRESLFDADRQLQAVRNRAGLTVITADQSLADLDPDAIEQQLVEQRSALAAARDSYREVYQGLGQPRSDLGAVPVILEDPAVRQKIAIADEVAEAHQRLLVEKGSRHVETVAAAEQLDAAENKVELEMLAAADRLRNNYERLAAAVADAERRLSNQSLYADAQAELLVLRARVDERRAAYYEQFAVVRDALPGLVGNGTEAVIESPAMPPLESVRWSTALVMLLTFVVCLLAGSALAAWLVLHNRATRKVVRGDFYSTTLECLHCGWTGMGASIALPQVERSGEPVTYACPDCLEVVAVHDIASDTEILDETEELEPKGGVLIWNIRI